MKIDIWSDYICPFCTLGERNLAIALESFEGADDVEVTWRSFQLDPNAPKEATDPYEYFEKGKGMGREQVDQMQEMLVHRAAEVGLTFNWREAPIVNTWDAHRVGHYAREQGKGNEWDHVVKIGYFTDGKNVADVDQLVAFGEDVGLDADRVREIAEGKDYTDHVNAEIRSARQLGIRGVPFFIFDGKLAVSGAQPAEVFTQALSQVTQMD